MPNKNVEHIKRLHGLRRAHIRGRDSKETVEALIAAIAALKAQDKSP